MSKYRNMPVVVDGIRFDSKAEARRWRELQLLEWGEAIFHLARQPVFPLHVGNEKIGDYRADFSYWERGNHVVEDVKSGPTRTPLYRWKAKHLKAEYHLDVREVHMTEGRGPGRAQRPAANPRTATMKGRRGSTG